MVLKVALINDKKGDGPLSGIQLATKGSKDINSGKKMAFISKTSFVPPDVY